MCKNRPEVLYKQDKVVLDSLSLVTMVAGFVHLHALLFFLKSLSEERTTLATNILSRQIYVSAY